MRVVLSGYYGFDNVGDEAILYSIIHALRDVRPDVNITVLSNEPEETRKTYGVEAVNRWKLKEVATAIKDSDGLISGGGSLLQDETGMKSIPYYTGIMKLAKWLGKPVFVYAQGMGPFRKKHNKWLVKNTLQSVQGITIRDEDSKRLLESIGIRREMDLVPDPVIGLSSSKFESGWMADQKITGKTVSVSVRDWQAGKNFKQRLAEALDRCSADGITVIFVPMHGKHDDETSREVAGLMKEKSLIAPYAASIEEKIAIFGKTDLLVGMRLHALIFAAIGYVPFVALSYDPKIDAFAEIAGQPVAGHVTMDDWSGESLDHEVRNVLDNHDQCKNNLRAAIEPLQQKAAETAKLALRTFEKTK